MASSSASVDDVMCVLLGPCGCVGTSCSPVARYTACTSSVNPAECWKSASSSSSPARRPTSSASSRRGVASAVLAVDVAHPGRDLEHLAVERRAGTGARGPRPGCRRRRRAARPRPRPAAHDVALERSSRRGPRTSPTDHAPDVALVDSRSPSCRNPPAHAERARRGSGTSPAGAATFGPRPAPSAAPTNSRNSGCGRSGRLLNSGWACVPTQNGWPAAR